MIKLIESLSGKDVIDITTTGTSYYDQLIPGDKENDYMKLCKNSQATIEYMSPDEYIERCAYDIFGRNSLETTMNGVDRSNVKKYAELMSKGEKFPLPYLNYKDRGQEGRHRALAAKELGIKKIPVLIVTEYNFKHDLGLPDGVDFWYGNTFRWYDKDGNERRSSCERNEESAKEVIERIKKSGIGEPPKEDEEDLELDFDIDDDDIDITEDDLEDIGNLDDSDSKSYYDSAIEDLLTRIKRDRGRSYD